jgi:hypothetical protein
MTDYVPNLRVCEKIADVWTKLIANPEYDNGDPSSTGLMCRDLAEKSTKKLSKEQLEKFRESLVKVLMGKNKYGGRVFSLCVDYGPDENLSVAAKEAGMDVNGPSIIGFPWKTKCFIGDSKFSISIGYGQPSTHYYPLKDGKWLLTKLEGDDIQKIIKFVEDGILPQFEIEGVIK